MTNLNYDMWFGGFEMDYDFCIKCGSKLEIRTSEPIKFNPKTGKEIQKKCCSNISCPIGCTQNGYHQFSRNWLGFKNKCIRCGCYYDSW